MEYCELNILDGQTNLQVYLRCKLETTKEATISIIDGNIHILKYIYINYYIIDQNINTNIDTDQMPNV